MNNEEAAFLWIDLETTGPDPYNDHILEVAYCLTDSELNVQKPMSSVIVSPKNLSGLRMTQWCWEAHTKSGLISDIEKAEESEALRMDVFDVDEMLCSYIEGIKIPVVLAGHTVHFDRAFINARMMDLPKKLHYRNFDVRTLEFAGSWVQKTWVKPVDGLHRAKVDLEHSLKVAREFKDMIQISN